MHTSYKNGKEEGYEFWRIAAEASAVPSATIAPAPAIRVSRIATAGSLPCSNSCKLVGIILQFLWSYSSAINSLPGPYAPGAL